MSFTAQQSGATGRTTFAITALSVLGFFALACGFFDSEIATVTYEEAIPIDFDIDADELCPADQECGEEQAPTDEDIELDPIEESFEIDIVEKTGNDELRDVTSRMRSLEITSIDYEVTDNDLTFDLPEVDIFVAPVGVEDTDHEDSILLTTLPSVPAETDDEGRADVIEENRQASSELFKKMEFEALPRAQPVIQEGQPFPPSGTAEIVLTINIMITANPTDDI